MRNYVLILCFYFLVGCNSKKNPPENPCENVDDCIFKNSFEQARVFASKLGTVQYKTHTFRETEYFVTKNEALFKIICAEAQFYINRNELKRAKELVLELRNIRLVNGYGQEGDRITKDELKEKHIEFIHEIINKYCEQEFYEEAELCTNELPESEIKKESIYFDGDGSISKCRKKYNEYKKKLKSNQEIDLFNDTADGYYTVTTTKNFQDEAKKLIETKKNKKESNLQDDVKVP